MVTAIIAFTLGFLGRQFLPQIGGGIKALWFLVFKRS